MKKYLSLIILTLLSLSCECQDSSTLGFSKNVFSLALERTKAFQLNYTDAKKDLLEIAKEPHPLGSSRQRDVANYLALRARDYGLETYEESFTVDTPNPNLNSSPIIKKTGINVFIKPKHSTSYDCTILVGSHYDTKILPNTAYLGANDSGSSSILLLQIIKYASEIFKDLNTKQTCGILGVFFDGEEAQLLEWDDSRRHHPSKILDNTYGSRFLAGQLSPCNYLGKKAKCLPFNHGGNALIAFILLDMVGSKNIKISEDSLSTPFLFTLMKKFASTQKPEKDIFDTKQTIFDDHQPFLQSGVFAIDIIDFNHLDNWHREGDDISNISFESIELAGRLAIPLIFSLAIEPKVFLAHADHK